MYLFEFSLKTDSGYPNDAGDNQFTLANPGNPLRYNIPWSAHQSAPSPIAGKEEVPVSSLTYSNMETPIDRPRVVRGLLQRSSADRQCQPSCGGQVLACTESATLKHSATPQCIISLLCRLRRVSESPGVVTASHLSGACINVTFLRKSAPTENQYFKIDQNKIDPSYMVCGRLVATLFRISPPPA